MIEMTDDFETILVCAERYALGRQTYIPMLVINYIIPLLPKLSDKTLAVFERDIEDAGYYGDEIIDKPDWMRFLEKIKNERRKNK